ncbi:MAG: glutamate-5-semialdehyde dehydrogenase [Lentisphaeria bacterium]
MTIDYTSELAKMGSAARTAARKLALLQGPQKNRCLEAMADELQDQIESILEANEIDMQNARKNGLSSAMLDRLQLDEDRLAEMAKGLRTLVGLEDPTGRVDSTWLRPNGLKIRKVRVPIGVISIIYEARPNVTADAAGLCLKAGNAVFLRGGSESINSNKAIVKALKDGIRKSDMSPEIIQLMPWTERQAVNALLKMDHYIDLIIPRGGEGLIRKVVATSTIPVIKHYKGVCHVYVDKNADQDMALKIVENAKCQRPGVCNAVETVLIHREIAQEFVPKMAGVLLEKGVELRGDSAFCELVPQAKPATDEDWTAEYLDLILAVRIVDSMETAVQHISDYGSAHSEAIVTENRNTATYFQEAVDAAAVYVNASTRFTDGGEFGMGAEIGVSTDRIHARGPMGLDELTSYKYVISGSGQIRT